MPFKRYLSVNDTGSFQLAVMVNDCVWAGCKSMPVLKKIGIAMNDVIISIVVAALVARRVNGIK